MEASISQHHESMRFYFAALLNESATVLWKQLKLQEYKFKILWSSKWFQYIIDHPTKPWNYRWLSTNPNVSWELIQAYPHLFNDCS